MKENRKEKKVQFRNQIRQRGIADGDSEIILNLGGRIGQVKLFDFITDSLRESKMFPLVASDGCCVVCGVPVKLGESFCSQGCEYRSFDITAEERILEEGEEI
jgi:hypothetical protein